MSLETKVDTNDRAVTPVNLETSRNLLDSAQPIATDGKQTPAGRPEQSATPPSYDTGNLYGQTKVADDKAQPVEAKTEAAEAAKPELEKSLPSADKFAAAEKAAGLTMSATDLREGMIKHAQHDIANGSLKTSDLTKFPRVGGAFVATGAVTEAEMDKALAQQKELGAAAKDSAKPPRIGAVLEEMFKDNPEKLGKVQAASKFYDELQKLSVEKK